MSIPPFLSSTPPPPDKCEDRDQEEYDIHYNLSQDEDSEEHPPNINTATFNNYQNKNYNIPDLNVANILNSINSEFTESQTVNSDLKSNLEISDQDDTPKSNSDSIVEDLQLTVEANEASESSFKDANENSCPIEMANTNSDISSVDSSPQREPETTNCAYGSSYSSPKIVLDELSDIESFQISTNLNLEEEVMHDLGFTNESKNGEFNIATDKKEIYLADNQNNSDFTSFDDLNFSNDLLNNDGVSDGEFNLSDVKFDDFKISDDEKVDNKTSNNIFSEIDVKFEDFEFPDDVNIDHTKPNSLENCMDFDIDDLKLSHEVQNTNFTSDNVSRSVNACFDNLQFPNDQMSIDNVANTSDDSNLFSNFTQTSKLHSDIKNETIVDSKLENDTQMGILSDEDDFGDFDTFRSSEVKVNTSVNIDDKLDNRNQPSFDSFQADFNTKTDEEVDTFDDFEDFKTSNDEECNDLNINNLESFLKEVFEDTDLKVDEKYVGLNLESQLSTMWHCLRDVDARQPYIVNWNRSNAQQYLLKSLKINMTDVMSMPKLNPNMPRYASNLSTAPLQPMKSQPSILGSGDGSGDSIQSKTTDSVQCTYAEALLVDLENLMATLDRMTSNDQTLFKISDLMTNAYPVQQQAVAEQEPTLDSKISQSAVLHPSVRQINLPETHIFTPINSNTPQSQTVIHEAVINNDISDDEFQDFQSTITVNQSNNLTNQPPLNSSNFSNQPTLNSNNFSNQPPMNSSNLKNQPPLLSDQQEIKMEDKQNVLKPTPIFASGLNTMLQPVKVESLTPALNWPDPGKVETTEYLDDFTDFISGNETINSASKPQVNVRNEVFVDEKEDLSKNTLVAPLEVKICEKTATNLNHTNNLTDFSNFQFAPLPSQPVKLHVNGLVNPVKHPYNNSIELKPTKVDYSMPQANKPQQILQPLSLEGYSSINWPSPGLDLQDLSRFNPLNVLPSMSTGSSSNSKNTSPQHQNKKQQLDEDWGDFVSTVPKPVTSNSSNVMSNVMSQDDNDDWSDFVSSVPKPNGINTISFNVSSNSSQKVSPKNIVDIPKMNFVTPKATGSSKRVQNNLFENL